MSKITLNNLVNLQNETSAVSTINNNSAAITTAFDNTLSRDGASPNTMGANLDMNNNQILNLPSPASVNSPARLIDVVSNPTIQVPPVGTSGATVPLLNANNTFSGNNSFTGSNTFSIGTTTFTGSVNFSGTVTGAIPNGGATGSFLKKISATNGDANWTSNFTFDDAGMKMSLRGTQLLYWPTGFADSSLFIGSGGNSLSHTGALEGYYNTFVGLSTAGALTTGSYNTGVGFESMFFTTTGSYNTGCGEATLIYNITGNGNTAVGWKALLGNLGVGYGDYNTAVGYASGWQPIVNTTTANTSLGAFSLSSASLSGSQNTALGYLAGATVTSGGFNTCLGYNSGNGLVTGSNNIIIGAATIAAAQASSIIISTGDGNVRFFAGADGSVKFNNGTALATNATGGHLYIPSCVGTPTGVPSDFNTGRIPLIVDTTSNKLYIYNSAWKSVTLA